MVRQKRKVAAVKLSWSRKEPFSPAEQAASREVNRHSTGRKARTTGAVEHAVDGGTGRIEGVPELPAGLLQRTRDAISVETGIRLDIHAAHADWQRWVAGMKEPIRSPAGHFVDFWQAAGARAALARGGNRFERKNHASLAKQCRHWAHSIWKYRGSARWRPMPSKRQTSWMRRQRS